MYCIVLYCIVLCCVVLYCVVLRCVVLYCIVLYCVVLYCIHNLSDNCPPPSVPSCLTVSLMDGISLTFRHCFKFKFEMPSSFIHFKISKGLLKSIYVTKKPLEIYNIFNKNLINWFGGSLKGAEGTTSEFCTCLMSSASSGQNSIEKV